MTNDEINNTRFLNVGTSSIYHELFCPPFAYEQENYYCPPEYNKTSFKCTGGFWLTRDTGCVNSNEWLFYISTKEHLLQTKYSNQAVSIKLDNPKIIIPSTIDDLLQIQEKYPIQFNRNNSSHNLIDYHELAKDYDGIFIPYELAHDPRLKDWCVRTLILFNLNHIKNYHSKVIESYKEGYHAYYFEEASRSGDKIIPPISSKYVELLMDINKLYQKMIENRMNNVSVNNYREFIDLLWKEFDKLLNDNNHLYKEIKERMKIATHHDYLNDNQAQQILNAQLKDKNYETVNDIYKKSLRR